MKKCLLVTTALIATLASTVPNAQATTFDISTLNSYSGTGAKGYYTGPNRTGTYVFNTSTVQQNPWTQGTGSGAASLNFSIPGQGNNSGKIYTSAGGPFPIPTGQTLGVGENGLSGDYALSSLYPLYFAFSNPAYDNNCGFNCNTVTLKPVVLNSLDLSTHAAIGITILGYNGLPNQGAQLLDTYTTTTAASGITNVVLNWTNASYIDIVGSSPGTCFGGYACVSDFYLNDIQVNDPVPIDPSVPEPMSLALLATGIAGVILARSRKATTA